jgi:hypothetical protein
MIKLFCDLCENEVEEEKYYDCEGGCDVDIKGEYNEENISIGISYIQPTNVHYSILCENCIKEIISNLKNIKIV